MRPAVTGGCRPGQFQGLPEQSPALPALAPFIRVLAQGSFFPAHGTASNILPFLQKEVKSTVSMKKKSTSFLSRSPTETKKIGVSLARKLSPGDLICFCGQLGSGKTTMIKGIIHCLTGKVATSPSFTIMHEYQGSVPVYHFDFYRLKQPEDLETIGWQEYLNLGIVLVEWADRFPELLRQARYIVTLKHLKPQQRKILVVELEQPETIG